MLHTGNLKKSVSLFISFTAIILYLSFAVAACRANPQNPAAASTTAPTGYQTVAAEDGSGTPLVTTTPPLNGETNDQSEVDVNTEGNSQLTENEALQPTPRPILIREIPEDLNWKSLPIMPEISENAFEIYRYGLSLGRNPQNISVIGDCQAIPFVFLGKYGIKQYTLESADTYLEKMISYYRESFAREGNAVRGGFTAAAVLSSVRADPDHCAPGETPLDCEWRVQNPSIAFINLETWREEGTVDRYELYLQKIVEFSIEQGTLPIIIMKADKAESETHVINPAMARVAIQYDVPIINFWQAAQYLENFGIDPEREGFHLSEAGYDRKQILALRTLYLVWSETNTDLADVEESAIEATPTVPEPDPTATVEAMPVLNFQCRGSCVYYDLYSTTSGEVLSMGITELNTETLQKELISEPGISLQDVSLNQQYLLINRGPQLFMVDRKNGDTRFILDNLFTRGGSSAYFDLAGSNLIILMEQDGQNKIVRYNLSNDQYETIYQGSTAPVRLITYRPTDALYWESGACPTQDFCQTDGLWLTELENGPSTLIEGKERLSFSADGLHSAFRDPVYADEINYFHNPVLIFEETETGIQSRRLFFFPHPGGFRVHPEVSAYVFSHDGSKLFVLFDEYSDYFEKSLALHFYVEDLTLRMVFEHGKIEGAYGSLQPQVIWSPDGTEILLLLVNTTNDRDYSLEFYRKDTVDRFSELIQLGDPLALEGYAFIHRAYWIKDGE